MKAGKVMPGNAKRQRGDGGGERINTLVNLAAKKALERLVPCYGVTQRTMLERVIAEAEIVLLAGLSSKQQAGYYKK
jgi:hypothetical protein